MTVLAWMPIIFILFVAIFLLLNIVARKSASQTPGGEHELDPYACGQQGVQHFFNPDGYKIFAYAFFFTIMHVLVLIVATAPKDARLLPVAYIIAGVLAMVMLFRWKD